MSLTKENYWNQKLSEQSKELGDCYRLRKQNKKVMLAIWSKEEKDNKGRLVWNKPANRARVGL